MFMDLDHFKLINDSLGHDVGDQLLQQVAVRLQGCVREGDSVSRFGGDEFVLLLDGLSAQTEEAAQQAEVSAHKILKALAQPYVLGQHTCHSSVSIGLVLFQGHGQILEELLKKADTAMYQAKASGRNKMCFYDAATQAAALAYAERVTDLQRGLAADEFVLYYQIQVDQNAAPLGAEALARWQHPTRGLVMPAEFIALAEVTRLMLPLGQWVLQAACTQLAAWAHNPSTARWTMSVNVSELQFAQADFVAQVQGALLSSGAKPGLLKLELTESMLVGDVPAVIAKMAALQGLGVRFELDDFGTGYSSLSYLKHLPLERLKIDQSFVRDLAVVATDTKIIRAIVALSHSLGLSVIAEGVETPAQRELLVSLDCDAFQGYLFGRPVAAVELAKVICQNPL
jgi:diguanylate cyclase (GGDEF)-like protein